MSNFIHYIPKPPITTYAKWTGENLEEINDKFGSNFVATEDGSLDLNNSPFFKEATVPVGRWFCPGSMGDFPDGEIETWGVQIVPDADIEYVINDPS